MKNSACHACGGRELETALAGPPRVLGCRRCGLLFLEEFPEAGVRKSYYQEEYYSEGDGDRFLGLFEAAVRTFRRARMRDILRKLPPARTAREDAFLDVGCGRGVLLELFRERGWRVAGTQVSETAARACERRLGEKVHCGELPELDLEPAIYRAIAFYHVLEHLDRPEAYLREAHRLLREDGLLVLEVPDAGALGFRLLGTRNFTFDHPHHLYFFTRRALEGLVRRSGFEVVAASTFSLEYAPFTALQNLLNVLPGEANRLYRSFMRNRDGARLRRSPLTWLHWALALVLAPAALSIATLGAVLPPGNTLRLYCRPTAGSARATPARARHPKAAMRSAFEE